MHVLDNGMWHALTGPQATVAERTSRAARYLPEVSVFAALADDVDPEAWDELRTLVGAGNVTSVSRRDLVVPDGWSVEFALPCRQMWLLGALAPVAGEPDTEAGAADTSVVTLGPDDVPEMLALVERTKPGPLRTRTIELGTYVGIRDRGALVAMAGERVHPPGFCEISAVCTESSHRGRGLASRLVRVLVDGIRERGEQPILHLTTANEPAYRIYATLGFETRMLVDVVGVRAPG